MAKTKTLQQEQKGTEQTKARKKHSFSINKTRLLQEAFSRSCLVWAADSGIRTEKAIPLNLQSHRFLKDIYDDWTPILTVRKASQIGFSTMMINKTLWAAKNKGWNIIYTLPTFGDVHQFVPSKVNPIIKINPELTDWTKDKDSTLQKQVGQGFIYYRGTFSQKSEKEKMESGVGIMLTSDLNVHDESDRSDQTILEQYESRLEASQFKGKWYFSNPTVPTDPNPSPMGYGTPTEQLGKMTKKRVASSRG